MKNLVLCIFFVIYFWSCVFAVNISTTANTTTTKRSTPSTTPLLSTRSKSSSPSTSVPITTSSNRTSTSVLPTSSPTPETTCSQKNTSCGDCVKDISCFWCAADVTCKKYDAGIKIIPHNCKGNKWYWKQCFVAGSVLIYVIPSVAFVVLVLTGCCVYCLCCRKRRQLSYQKEDRKMQKRREEAQKRNAERRADRKIRTDAIRQKYGLLTNEDDGELA